MPDYNLIETLNKHVKAVKKLDGEILALEQLLTQIVTEDCIIKFSVEQLSNNSIKDTGIKGSIEEALASVDWSQIIGRTATPSIFQYKDSAIRRVTDDEWVMNKKKSNFTNHQFSINSKACLLALNVIHATLCETRNNIVEAIEKITGEFTKS